jgi:hypothetical protein
VSIGKTDVTGASPRSAAPGAQHAPEAAHIIPTRPVEGSSLKSWAMRLAPCAGMRKARWRWRASWQTESLSPAAKLQRP